MHCFYLESHHVIVELPQVEFAESYSIYPCSLQAWSD